MADDWDRRDYIEGEYEVLEDRYIREEPGEHYVPRYDSYLHLNTQPPYATYIFLGLNIAAYLVMSLAGMIFGWSLNQQLLIFGAKENTLIAYGQSWRLFTAMFLHIGITHLFFNSYALYVYGPIVERLYGKLKFAVVYILSGLIGSLFSYMFSPNPAAGASGAIFGLMGSLLYFRQRKKDIFRRIFGTGLLMVIGVNLFYGMVQPNIDNWGHIGGLIGGYLAGNAIGLFKEKRFGLKNLLIWVLIAVMFVFGLRYGQEKYRIRILPPIPRARDSVQMEYPFAINLQKVEVTDDSISYKM